MWTTFYLVCVGLTVVSGAADQVSPLDQSLDIVTGYLCTTYVNKTDTPFQESDDNIFGQYNMSCDICKIIVQIMQGLVSTECGAEGIVELSAAVCKLLKVTDETVCYGMARTFKDEAVYVLNHLSLTPETACGIILDSCELPVSQEELWNVTFPDVPKPAVQPLIPPKVGSPINRILHLTDFHIDPMYEEGANAVCGEPLCCRHGNGQPKNASQAAGKWGDYRNCDLPKRTLENLFQHLHTNKHEFDVIYFTGDIPAHNVWNQSRDDQLDVLAYTTNLFRQYLPDVPVYSAVGNHESTPVDSFPQPFISGKNNISWLYSALAESWNHWLPANATDTILKGAFYTVSPYPGLRIISLNMNYCHNTNGWLLLNMTDPAGQLQWMISVLQDAENAKEKVHILGHIDPEECMKSFSWNYYKIINRYENTIAGQFFGHRHSDKFRVFYDEEHFTRPVSVLYIPGSVTTNVYLNPGFRIYQVDGYYPDSSHYPLRYQNYFLNITEANLSDNPQWTLEYDTQIDLGLKNIYPADWDALIYRMKYNESLFQQYYRYTSKLADQEPCSTGACKTKLLCAMKTARSFETNDNICSDL